MFLECFIVSVLDTLYRKYKIKFQTHRYIALHTLLLFETYVYQYNILGIVCKMALTILNL